MILNNAPDKLWNELFSTAVLRSDKPINKIPKPATTSPKILTLLFLERRGIAPINAKKQNIGIKTLYSPIEAINEVTVVPMLAPIIHAHAWNNVIAPKSASLTSVTLVTSDDCTTTVYKNPKPAPSNLFLQLNPLVKKDVLLIEAWTKPLDIKLMPTKKHPHAVRTVMIANNESTNAPAKISIITYYLEAFSSSGFFASLEASLKASATT